MLCVMYLLGKWRNNADDMLACLNTMSTHPSSRTFEQAMEELGFMSEHSNMY
jgi:hypothetical protein